MKDGGLHLRPAFQYIVASDDLATSCHLQTGPSTSRAARLDLLDQARHF